MIPQIGFLLLATAILLCTGQGYAMVPRPYDQSLGMMANNYADMKTMDSGSMKGCALGTLEKCYGFSFGETPENMIERISDIDSIQDCQWFCSFIYGGTCTWFVHDNKNKRCKLFSGQLEYLFNICKEESFSKYPSFSECSTAFNPLSDNGCYNFRQDYCRYQLDLIENLEHINNKTFCQVACQNTPRCNLFTFLKEQQICMLQYANFNTRKCDIVHGTAKPSFQSCLDNNKIPWANSSAPTNVNLTTQMTTTKSTNTTTLTQSNSTSTTTIEMTSTVTTPTITMTTTTATPSTTSTDTTTTGFKSTNTTSTTTGTPTITTNTPMSSTMTTTSPTPTTTTATHTSRTTPTTTTTTTLTTTTTTMTSTTTFQPTTTMTTTTTTMATPTTTPTSTAAMSTTITTPTTTTTTTTPTTVTATATTTTATASITLRTITTSSPTISTTTPTTTSTMTSTTTTSTTTTVTTTTTTTTTRPTTATSTYATTTKFSDEYHHDE